MELSEQQLIAFNKYIQGENIFITGPGGCGKSELIRKIYHDAIEKKKNIHVCALTGCAAVLLNCKAKTLHSWAGIGLGTGDVLSYVNKIRKNPYFSQQWKNTDILVVDEVSMMSTYLFEILNIIGKNVRSNSRLPFGGIQIILSGDFYQLPPVGNKDYLNSTHFCFESSEWNSVFPIQNQIQLIKIFRQTDSVYSSILNQIREGRIKRKSIDILQQYVERVVSPDLLIQPTKIYPTRHLVDSVNNHNMLSLNTEEHEFKAKKEYPEKFETNISVIDIQKEFEFLSNNLPCEPTLRLKIGAQVMCVVNIKINDELLLCNGSQGIVTSFSSGFPVVKYNNGFEMIMTLHTWMSEKITGLCISQIPLILAWALTIHKSQGSTLDAAEIDIGDNVFECGQTYVALSRVKSLDGLYLSSFNYNKIKINKKVKEFYEELTKHQAL